MKWTSTQDEERERKNNNNNSDTVSEDGRRQKIYRKNTDSEGGFFRFQIQTSFYEVKKK